MMRPPRTVKAALLVGFLVIFSVWVASTAYLTRHIAETQQRSAAIHAQFTESEELLFAVRSQVLLGSIYVRDSLIEMDHLATATADARDRLRRLQAQVNQELEQYAALEQGEHGAAWMQLQRELRDYWDAAVQLVASGADDRMAAQSRLHTEVVSKRDGIVTLSDEIRQVMSENARREQWQLSDADWHVRRRIWETTLAAVTVGVIIAILSTRYAGRLEAAVLEEHAEVARSRQELRQLSERLVRAQEDERRVIARELHDEIGQALTAVDVELAVAEGTVDTGGPATTAIHEARTVTRRALTGVRDLSQLLRPSMLDDFGLPATLKWYLRKFSDRTGVRTELVEERLADRLPIDVEVCVYRVVQEALTNVSRHAQATACRVFVQRLAASVIVTVEDDGIGLPATPAGAVRRDGLGLVGIRERVSGVGGTFRIEGQSGKGTRLTIELPLAASA